MRGELLFDGPTSAARAWPSSSPPALALLAALLTVVTCAALCAVAIVGCAPDDVVPLIVAICIGCPVLASWQVPGALATLRARRRAAHELAQMRRSLAKLPDTEHPLGRDG
jgi:hypothetical protein